MVLIACDLILTALLVLMLLCYVRGRFPTLPSFLRRVRREREEPDILELGAHTRNLEVRDRDVKQEGGGIRDQAANLKKQGFSVEEIARHLQAPTGEVEMVLALSEMGRPGGPRSAAA
jgi:hypothetical protein